MPPARREPLPRSILALASASFVFVAARMALVTYLSIFLHLERGIALPWVGAALLVENLARGGVGPFAGALADRVGRRRVMAGSVVASAAVMPLVLLVRDPAALLAWSLVAGLAQGPYTPAANALLLDLSPPERRQTALSLQWTLMSLGYALGVVPAGFLAERGFAWVAGASAALFLAAALVVVVLPKAARRTPPGPVLAGARLAGRDPRFLRFAAVAALFPLGIGLTAYVAPLYAVEAGAARGDMGLLLGATGLLIAALAVPVNRRLEARGPHAALPLAAAAAGASYVILAASPTLGAVAAALVVWTLAEVVFSAGVPAVVAGLALDDARGAYMGAWSGVSFVALGLGPFLASLGRDALGWQGTWLLFAAHAAVAAALLAAGRNGPGRRDGPEGGLRLIPLRRRARPPRAGLAPAPPGDPR